MEEFKAKRHAVKKMTRKGLVETDSREGIVKETAEAKSGGRRVEDADEQQLRQPEPADVGAVREQIGRASCRERV